MGEVKIIFKKIMRKDGKKTFFIHSYFVFLFGGKFRCKPQFDARDQISEDSKLSARTPFFPF